MSMPNTIRSMLNSLWRRLRYVVLAGWFPALVAVYVMSEEFSLGILLGILALPLVVSALVGVVFWLFFGHRDRS